MLGVPGLINAYRSAAEDALNKAVIVQKTVNDIYTIQFNYLQMNDVMRIIKDDDLAIIKQNFDNDCSIKVSIRKTRVNQTLGKFNNLTGVILKYEETK
jgi:putative IMPACT (imprinted ancient) family translation regulator